MTNAFGDARDAISGLRSEQGREIQDRLQRQRTRHRQPGQRLGHQPVGQLGARAGRCGRRHARDLEDRAATSTRCWRAPCSSRREAATAAASRCCGRTARSIPARRSRAAVFPVPGLRPSTATTTSGFPTSPMPNSPIAQLCGVRTENCPPGMKTGDQISPPGGYVGGGLQMQTDLAIDPAGDVWVMNNWQDIDSCFGDPRRSALDPLRRPGRDDLLRHGQAGARAADRPGARAVGVSRRRTPPIGRPQRQDPITALRLMTGLGHSRRSDGQQGFAECPLCLQWRPNLCVATNRRDVP